MGLKAHVIIFINYQATQLKDNSVLRLTQKLLLWKVLVGGVVH